MNRSVAVDDSQHWRSSLDFAAGYFPYVMTTWVTYPVREDLVERQWRRLVACNVGELRRQRAVQAWPVTRQNQEWVFERNDDYYRRRAGHQRPSIYKEVDSAETELLAYQQGEFDLIGPSSTHVAAGRSRFQS